LSDIEILARIERRRVWTADEKAALLAEVDAEGGKVRLVARRHRMSESLLYNWRSVRKAAASLVGAPEGMEFLPVGVVVDANNDRASMRPSSEQPRRVSANEGGTGEIGITLPNGARICVDASVNEKALSRVLRAVKGAL
jgi:transposase